MALIHRFSRLLSADLHAVMDRLEDPAGLLQQSQREMASALADERALLHRTERALANVEQQLQRLGKQLIALQQELDLCFEADDEALARGVIKRRLQYSSEQSALSEQQVALSAQRRELQERISAHQADLDSISAEAERLAEQPIDAPQTTCSQRHASISDEAIELALLAERRARGSKS